jgi:hypothetical protein
MWRVKEMKRMVNIKDGNGFNSPIYVGLYHDCTPLTKFPPIRNEVGVAALSVLQPLSGHLESFMYISH